MVSLYPHNLDTFRTYVEGFDQMISEDLDDLYDAVIAIQTELGINPAGDNGTIYGRLFGTGNVSPDKPGWRRLRWGAVGANGLQFNRALSIGFQVSFSSAEFAGRTSAFGEGAPAPFGALQAPLQVGTGPTMRTGVPWRTALNVVEPGRANWYGQDGDGLLPGPSPPARNPELNSSNSNPCTWGYLIWNLFT